MCTKFRSHSSYQFVSCIWHMWSHYNVLPGAICCCLQRNKYDQSLRVMDIYILTKFQLLYVVSFLSYGCLIWRRRRRWTKLSIIAPYIYDARYHANPYNYTKIILPYLVIYIWMTKVLSGGIMHYKQTSWGGVLTAKFIGIDVHAIYTSLN